MYHFINKAIRSILLILSLLCFYYFCIYPQSYPAEKAILHGDVVYTNNDCHNKNRLGLFLENVAKQKEDAIRITSYTREGYPQIISLRFKDSEIECIIDNTRNLLSHSFFKVRKKGTSIRVGQNDGVMIFDSHGNTIEIVKFCH